MLYWEFDLVKFNYLIQYWSLREAQTITVDVLSRFTIIMIQTASRIERRKIRYV